MQRFTENLDKRGHFIGKESRLITSAWSQPQVGKTIELFLCKGEKVRRKIRPLKTKEEEEKAKKALNLTDKEFEKLKDIIRIYENGKIFIGIDDSGMDKPIYGKK